MPDILTFNEKINIIHKFSYVKIDEDGLVCRVCGFDGVYLLCQVAGNISSDPIHISRAIALVIPISEITAAHAEETAKILNLKSDEELLQSFNIKGRIAFVKRMFLSNSQIYLGPAINIIFANRYLELHHYDTKNFFGPDHWANGKTAIELGLGQAKPV